MGKIIVLKFQKTEILTAPEQSSVRDCDRHMSNTTQHLCKKVLSRREDSTNEVSAYLVFCALIIAGLCFGQGIESAFDADVSLMLSRSIYIKPMEQINNSPMNEMAFNTTHNIPALNAFALMLQVEGESLQPKTSFWKQAGIYGLEFVGAGAGTGISYICLHTLCEEKQFENGPVPWLYGCGYAMSTTALTAFTTSMAGKIFNQKGSWQKAAIGAGISSTFISFISFNYHRFGVEYCILPPLGAVIGYNWQRDRFFRQAGIYSFEFMGGCAGLGLSFLSVCYFAFGSGEIEPRQIISSYTLTNMLFTGTTTTLTGKLFKQRGSWLRAAIGAGIGGLISSSTLYIYNSGGDYKPPPRIFGITVALLPPAGAVLGYNCHGGTK